MDKLIKVKVKNIVDFNNRLNKINQLLRVEYKKFLFK
jgi:hypothetical protein